MVHIMVFWNNNYDITLHDHLGVFYLNEMRVGLGLHKVVWTRGQCWVYPVIGGWSWVQWNLPTIVAYGSWFYGCNGEVAILIEIWLYANIASDLSRWLYEAVALERAITAQKFHLYWNQSVCCICAVSNNSASCILYFYLHVLYMWSWRVLEYWLHSLLIESHNRQRLGPRWGLKPAHQVSCVSEPGIMAVSCISTGITEQSANRGAVGRDSSVLHQHINTVG